MDKTAAIAFIKARTGQTIVPKTLERHTAKYAIPTTKVKGKTGDRVDYSEEALLEYIPKEFGDATPVQPVAETGPDSTEDTTGETGLAVVEFEAPQGTQAMNALLVEALSMLVKGRTDTVPLTEKLLLKYPEAAKISGFPEKWIRDAVGAKELKGIKAGRAVCVHRDDLATWVRHRVDSA